MGVDEDAYGGKATEKTIKVQLVNNNDAYEFIFKLILPKSIKEKIPVFLHLQFNELVAGGLGEEIIDNRYAIVHVCYQDIDPDGVDEVAQPTHEWGIRGQKMHEDSLMSLVLTHPSNRHQQSLSYDAPVGPRLTPSHAGQRRGARGTGAARSPATPPFTNCLRKRPSQRNQFGRDAPALCE